MSCRVKICGITNLEDALIACHHGADALGFVFYSKSPRYISPEAANAILDKLPPFIVPVALFVDAQRDFIDSVLVGSSRWIIQFHGNESDAECASYKRCFYKALRVKAGDDISSLVDDYPNTAAILLDAYKEGVPGGTGDVFDWSLIPSELSKPLVLAGGLSIENVQAAIERVSPYAVDVSGGVEQSKGIKSKKKVQRFIELVKTA